MTDLVTRLAILEAIQADVRRRVDRIVDRLERDVTCDDEPRHTEEALRDALTELAETLAEGIHAQMREAGRTAGDHGAT